MELNLSNPIAGRNTKTVYRDNDKTIKLFVENYSKANVLNEALIQSRVEENTDLSISKLIEVTKVQNRWALVTEYIDGTPLDVLMKQHPEKEEEYLDLFVNIQLEILSKKVPLLNRTKEAAVPPLLLLHGFRYVGLEPRPLVLILNEVQGTLLVDHVVVADHVLLRV